MLRICAVQLIVFFNADEKLGVKKLTEYIDRLKEDQIDRCILVLQKKLSGPANTERMLVRNSFVIEDVRSRAVRQHLTRCAPAMLVDVCRSDDARCMRHARALRPCKPLSSVSERIEPYG